MSHGMESSIDSFLCFFFQAEDGIRDYKVTGVQTCALPIFSGLPPAVALEQQRGSVTTRSSVGSVTTLSNLIRMLYSRAGHYPQNQPLLYAESFSPITAEGACPRCHGFGRIYDVSEASLVPDDSL